MSRFLFKGQYPETPTDFTGAPFWTDSSLWEATKRAEQNKTKRRRQRKQQKGTEGWSGEKFIFAAASCFAEHRLNLEIPRLSFSLMSSKLLESNWNLLRKHVFPLSSLQHIRLQELPFRSRGKTYGRAFPPQAVGLSPREERCHSSMLRDWLPVPTQPCGRWGCPLVPVWRKGSGLLLSPVLAARGSLLHTGLVRRTRFSQVSIFNYSMPFSERQVVY